MQTVALRSTEYHNIFEYIGGMVFLPRKGERVYSKYKQRNLLIEAVTHDTASLMVVLDVKDTGSW